MPKLKVLKVTPGRVVKGRFVVRRNPGYSVTSDVRPGGQVIVDAKTPREAARKAMKSMFGFGGSGKFRVYHEDGGREVAVYSASQLRTRTKSNPAKARYELVFAGAATRRFPKYKRYHSTRESADRTAARVLDLLDDPNVSMRYGGASRASTPPQIYKL